MLFEPTRGASANAMNIYVLPLAFVPAPLSLTLNPLE
jgi:hypothetical protein